MSKSSRYICCQHRRKPMLINNVVSSFSADKEPVSYKEKLQEIFFIKETLFDTFLLFRVYFFCGFHGNAVFAVAPDWTPAKTKTTIKAVVGMEEWQWQSSRRLYIATISLQLARYSSLIPTPEKLIKWFHNQLWQSVDNRGMLLGWLDRSRRGGRDTERKKQRVGATGRRGAVGCEDWWSEKVRTREKRLSETRGWPN